MISRIIEGVGAGNADPDSKQSEPLLDQLARRPQTLAAQTLVDGGFTNLGELCARGGAWGRGICTAAQVYQQRTATIETVNADLKTYCGLRRLLVRGAAKVLSLVRGRGCDGRCSAAKHKNLNPGLTQGLREVNSI